MWDKRKPARMVLLNPPGLHSLSWPVQEHHPPHFLLDCLYQCPLSSPFTSPWWSSETGVSYHITSTVEMQSTISHSISKCSFTEGCWFKDMQGEMCLTKT